MNWTIWIQGIISAAITGAATTVTTVVVAPEQFNATPEGITKIGIVAGVAAVLSVANFLKQSPIPKQ